ncbi:unnamed protein product [Linum tenue]|uniref:Uncharacterized protein n=1 Tax=Linum tenue TaxID=586396 RepID=A0AAV0LWS4_9ROSI|nr:unnamed protein product [Linum tenue]
MLGESMYIKSIKSKPLSYVDGDPASCAFLLDRVNTPSPMEINILNHFYFLSTTQHSDLLV